VVLVEEGKSFKKVGNLEDDSCFMSVDLRLKNWVLGASFFRKYGSQRERLGFLAW